MNKIVVYFTTCSPAPSGGYNIRYRVAGGGAYINAGNFFISPAVFYDTINPFGTCYEGFMQTVCGDIFGNQVSFETCGSGESGDNTRTLTFSVAGGGVGANIQAAFDSPVDVTLSIDSVFVDGYIAADCTGSVDSHMHSTSEAIASGNTVYIGFDVKTGTWMMVSSYVFYGIVLSWPGNSGVIVHNGDVVIMGSYSVTIIIEGC